MVTRIYNYASKFTKDGKTCTVITTYRGTTRRTGEIAFGGWNPFPCFSMVSNYETVANWLIANGWLREPYYYERYTEDSIDDETGEVLSHSFEEKTIDRRPVCQN